MGFTDRTFPTGVGSREQGKVNGDEKIPHGFVQNRDGNSKIIEAVLFPFALRNDILIKNFGFFAQK